MGLAEQELHQRSAREPIGRGIEQGDRCGMVAARAEHRALAGERVGAVEIDRQGVLERGAGAVQIVASASTFAIRLTDPYRCCIGPARLSAKP